VQCVVTSPPYWGLRNYNVKDQIGLERTPEAYVEKMVAVFREVKRVLRDDGTCWLNLGDSFQDKQLVGMPWRVAFALQADGWYLRSDIIWAKGVSFCPDYTGSVMPESVTDRPTKSHEYLFLLTKSARYYYDADAVRERATATKQRRLTAVIDQPSAKARKQAKGQNPTCQGGVGDERNLRSVWTINPKPYAEAHFATFPEKLVEPCVKAGTKHGDTVLDPFVGSGTTGLVAGKLGREFIGIELNADYITLAQNRIEGPLFATLHDSR
jgi:DNA modification methylase